MSRQQRKPTLSWDDLNTWQHIPQASPETALGIRHGIRGPALPCRRGSGVLTTAQTAVGWRPMRLVRVRFGIISTEVRCPAAFA